MTRPNYLRWPALLLGFLLASCAVAQVHTDSRTEGGAREGVVVFSVSHDLEGGRYGNTIIYLDGGLLGGRGGGMYQSSEKILGIPKGSEYDDVHGRLHVVSLAAGEHEFTSWQITNGSGLRILPGKGTAPRRFQVTAGEIVYLGNFHGNLVRGRNIFGIAITGDGMVSVDEAEAKDFDLLYRRYPQFRGQVKTELLAKGLWSGS